MMGDIGAVAELINTWSKWLLDPDGFAQLTLEQKLERLHKDLQVAVANGASDAADRIFAEYKRLSQRQ